jgi:hypothetical protein
MSRRAVALVAALILTTGVVAACGDDGDDGGGDDRSAYVEAMTTSLVTVQEGEIFGAFPADEAACIAEHTVDAVGTDFFVDNDITADELEEATGIEALGVALEEGVATEAAEAYRACEVDLGRLFTGGAGTATVTECINGTVDMDAVVAAVAARLQGNEVEAQELSTGTASVVSTCVAAG